jgi:phosphatidylinositol alpha-1,6-mannosyltransferase
MKLASVTFGYPDREHTARAIFTHEQAKALARLGVDVRVYDLAADPKLYPEPARDVFGGVTVHRLPLESTKRRPWSVLSRRRQLARLLADDPADVALFSFLRHDHLKHLSVFEQAGCLLALTVHGTDAMAAWQTPLVRLLKRRVIDRMRVAFPVSDFTATLTHSLVRPERHGDVVVNYNGIDCEKLAAAEALDPRAARAKLGLDAARPILLTAADLVKRKGIDLVVRAVAELKKSGVATQYVVVGLGPEQAALQELARSLGVAEEVRFVGRVRDDADFVGYYVACDVFCMPSRTTFEPPACEGFGIANVEAQFFGKPVIGGRSGGVPSAVAHGFTGFLVDPDAPTAASEIADVARRLLTDRELYATMSRNARQFARGFDWERNARTIVEAIEARR